MIGGGSGAERGGGGSGEDSCTATSACRDRPVVGRDWLIEVGIPVLDLVEMRRRLGDRFLLRDRCVLGGATGEFDGGPFGHRSGRCRFDGGGRDPFRLGVRCGDRFRGTDSLLCDLVVECAAALVDQRCQSRAQLPECAVDVDGVGSRFGVDRVLHRPAQLQRQHGDARTRRQLRGVGHGGLVDHRTSVPGSVC